MSVGGVLTTQVGRPKGCRHNPEKESPVFTSWHLKKGETSRVARMSFSRSR